ncbi:type IV secretory system conjugative DNA transfer family protein [Rhizobiaceae bacterium CRRU44]|uniref:Type IV secretory system conjugative DNA transfer family protein n=1 Tax=Ferranicluibacter rubi TaxID=2715133 RepID=A0AA43ZJ83_9HYPH|nr:TraM recognition domain-containing protein [Ferranicluibacter rubi]NHT78925.1 type IV secretory system conjugative DNA transfer family protein [Ferranicluibacter rubi]
MFAFLSRASGKVRDIANGYFARSASPLLRGDLVAYAEQEYPRAEYETAWKTIPADVKKGLVWDGRLLNGKDVAELAKGQLTDDHVWATVRKAGRRAAIIAVALPVFLLAVSSLSQFGFRAFGMTSGGQMTPYPSWADQAGLWLPVLSWYALAVIERVWSVAATVLSFGPPLLALFFVFWWFGFVRGMNRLWASMSGPLRVATRDAKLLWKTEMASRLNDYKAYRRQVLYATTALKHEPLVQLGTATGLLETRGDRRAPLRNQAMSLDGHSLRQHGIFVGPTGAQKTTLGILPVARAILHASWGVGHKIGAFVMDGKGGLWREMMEFVSHRNDVKIIGLGDGQYGVDLLAGMAPHEVGAVYQGVLGQVSGDSKADFWTRSSADLIVHAATVAQALAYDEETVAEWVDEFASHPYSLLGIMALATEQAVIEKAVEKLKENAPHLNGKLSEAEKVEYKAAYDSAAWFIGTFWADSNAKETRSGIIQTLTSVLGSLRGERELLRRFGAGTYADLIDVDYALKGGIVMVAMGPQNSIGSKLVTCWLKSRLYIMALRRYEVDPEQCKTSTCLMIADEFQSLVTQGHDSDSDFWNRARSSGLLLWAATQSWAAIEQIIGETATKNLMDCMRSKVFFASEEVSTMQYCQTIAGNTWQGLSADNIYPTYAARKLAMGDEGDDTISLGWLGGIVPTWFTAPTEQAEPYSIAHLLKFMKGGGEGTGLQLSLRNEDRNRAALVEGVTKQPSLDLADLRMGSGLAFAVVMRAGVARMDVIDLINEDYAEAA